MLRVARISDGPAVADAYRCYFEETAAASDEIPPDGAQMSQRIGQTLASLPFLVFERDMKDGEGEPPHILGFAHASPIADLPAGRWAVEETVCVSPDARGRGLGKALLGALLEILRAMGYLRVFAVVAVPNPAGIALHEALGFAMLCHSPESAYKLGAWRDVDWLQLTLRGPSNFAPGVAPLEPLKFREFARANKRMLEKILDLGVAQ